MHSPALAQLTVHQRTDWEYTLFPPPTTPRPDGSWQGRCQFYDGITLLAEPLVSILPDGSVNLRLNRVQTAIKPGQYTFDLLLESSDGKRQKQYWGTVIVQETVTRWGESPVPPPIEPEPLPAWLSDFVNEAIATHNADSAAHPGLGGGVAAGYIAPSRQLSIAQADLDIAGSIAIAFEAGDSLGIWDENGFYVEPEYLEVIGSDTAEIGLFDFAPLVGIWHLAIASRFNSARYEQTFTQSNIASNSITITHGLGGYPARIDVFEESGQSIEPDSIQYISANAIAISLVSFVPIPSAWTVEVR